MSYAYQHAPYVYSGSAPTSEQYISRSNAWNDRIKIGLGDVTYRIHQQIFGLFRQIRNPAAAELGLSLVWPPLNEYLKYYAHLDADKGTWPTAAAGDNEGANTANPVAAFVFGNNQQYGEADRLNGWLPQTGTENNPTDNWKIGKYQRGAYDPNSGVAATPFADAAQSYLAFSQPGWSFHGKGAPAYYPIPKVLGWCTNPDGTQYHNFQYFFTNINTGDVVTYNGSCSPDAGGSGNDVAGVLELPFAYWVYKWDGTIDKYNTTDWIEGPYTGGGSIRRINNGALQDLLIYQFIKDFRGADIQRTSSCYVLPEGETGIPIAFNFEEYFTSQDQLAPAWGQYNGQTITADYPALGVWYETITSGSTSEVLHVPAGFRVGAIRIGTTGLVQTSSIQINHGDSVENWKLALSQSVQIKTFPSGSTSDFKIEFTEDVPLSGSNASLDIVVSVLVDQKPNVWDAYALLRMGSTKGSDESQLDYTGFNYEHANHIWQNYKQYGMSVGYAPMQATSVLNTNPVLESARKQIQKWIKVIGREQLIGYEVSGSKSILYFNPYALGNSNFDSFKYLYKASDTGSNGIINSPATASWSNEWVLDVCLKNYGGPMNGGNNNASEFKPDVYGDYFGWLNRAHLFDPRITAGTNADMFVAGMQVDSDIQQLYRGRMYAPEYPSGYNYAQSTNLPNPYWDTNQRIAYYSSNLIYPEPAQVEDCRFYNLNGSQVIRVQLDRRLQYTGDAPGTVSIDRSTWDLDNLRSQVLRTMENGIMQYLVAKDGTEEGNVKIGDASTMVNLYGESGDHHGACIPEFYFTKLIPRPYEDNTSEDGYELRDTVIRSDDYLQMAFYLKAMCGGFVDGTREAACDEGTEFVFSTAFDYKFENLCFDSFGGKWLTSFPETIRPDDPYGIGPLPNTKYYASLHNQLAACINSLTRVRVPLPFVMECRESRYSGSVSVAPTWAYQDNPVPCSNNANVVALTEGVAAFAIGTLLTQGEWSDCCTPESCGFTVEMNAGWTGGCSNDGTNFRIDGTKNVIEYRFSPYDPSAIYCMSEGLRELYGLPTVGFFARYNEQYVSTHISTTNTLEDSVQCQLSTQTAVYPTWDGTTGYAVNPGADSYQINTCKFFSSTNGTIDPGNPGASDYLFLVQRTGQTIADCSAGVSRFIGITPTNQTEVVVQVPFR